MFVDVHTHLDQHDPAELPGIVTRARAAGVGAIIVAGVTVLSSRRSIELAHAENALLAGVGVHPMDLEGGLSPADADELDRMAADPRVVVMSEIGLDHKAGVPDHRAQEDAFRAQIAIARRHGLAIVYHNREAAEHTLRVLAEEGASEVGGAAHYFQGDWQTARRVLDLGFYVSLAKPLLRLPELQDVARRLPLDRVVLETDAYPQPFKRDREKWTEPRDIPDVAAKLAELHGLEIAEIEEHTTANALRMLGPRGALAHPSTDCDTRRVHRRRGQPT